MDEVERRTRLLSRTIAMLLAVTVGALVAASLLAMIAVLFFFSQFLALLAGVWNIFSRIPPANFGWEARLDILIYVGLAAVPSILILRNVSALFAAFARGEVFVESNIIRLRSVGLWLFVYAATSNLAQFLLDWFIGTRGNYEFPDLHLLPLLLGAMTIVAAHVMSQARRIAAENAEII